VPLLYVCVCVCVCVYVFCSFGGFLFWRSKVPKLGTCASPSKVDEKEITGQLSEYASQLLGRCPKKIRIVHHCGDHTRHAIDMLTECGPAGGAPDNNWSETIRLDYQRTRGKAPEQRVNSLGSGRGEVDSSLEQRRRC